MIFTMSLSVFALTRTEWISLFDTKNTPDYSTLEYALDVHAWAHSYQLQSLLRMYQATGDTKYLAMFAMRANNLYTVFTNGKLITAKYAEDLARQGYCEAVGEFGTSQQGIGYNFSAGWPASYWTRNDATDVKVESGTGFGWDDNYALTIQSDTVNQNQAIFTFTPVANNNYIITFMCKAGNINGASLANPPEVLVVKASDGTVLCQRSFYPSDYGLDKGDGWDDEIWSWNKESVWFKTDANPTPVNVIFRLKDYTKANSKAVFDNVTVYHNGQNCMPLGWSRISGTSSSYVCRDTTVTPVHISGAACVTINMPSGAAQGGAIFTPVNYNVNDNRNYEPSSEYYYEFYAKVASGGGAQYSLVDTTAGTNLISPTAITAGSSWTKISGKFSTPSASGDTLEFRFFQTSGTAVEFHIDDLLVRRYSYTAVDDGMVAVPLSEFYEMVTKNMTPAGVNYNGQNYDLVACASICKSFVDGLIGRHAAELVTVGDFRKVYVVPDDGSLKHLPSGNSLPHNQYLAMGISSAIMYRATGDTSYRDRANSLGLTFTGYLTYYQTQNSYAWYYNNPGILSTDRWQYVATEDSSHANIDIDFVIEAMKSGLSCIELSDMQKFANTFTQNMWNYAYNYPRGSVYPNLGTDVYEYLTYTWIRLNKYDSNVYTLIRNKWDSETASLPWSVYLCPCLLNVSEIINGMMVINEPFETPDSQDNTLPAGWSRWQSDSFTAYLDSGNALEGNNCLTVKTNGVAWQIIEKPLTYDAGATYRVKIMGKVGGVPTVGGVMTVYDFTTSSQLAVSSFTSTDWNQTVFTFTAPAASGNNVKLRLYTTVYNVTGGIIHFDNVEIRKIE
jgi:hypothetical protein